MHAQPTHLLNLLNGDVQYVIPRWQRRYCWGDEDIKKLIEDLRTIAKSDEGSIHYTGTLLTLNESAIPGSVNVFRVIDGQQRLTTVSILLACIAEALNDGACIDDWTSESIRNKRLLNLGFSFEKRHKLKLQREDEIEYEAGLDGIPSGIGAITQAWHIIRRELKNSDLTQLKRGLERLHVVSIGLSLTDDPQQIFESINATGRPLTESEKVKNWLLIGLPEEEQNDLVDKTWKNIETALGAEQSSQPIDVFLRDFLRWKTGEYTVNEGVYEVFRRWAIQNNDYHDRPKLCRELARLAVFYGQITGTSNPHPSKLVKHELDHLRAMSIDVHRPFTLRLMHDCDSDTLNLEPDSQLAESLSYISTWITRLWLSGFATGGLNKAFIDLARDNTKGAQEGKAAYWKRKIGNRRKTRIGVPNDDEVISGIATRIAYGGSAARSSMAVFRALMLQEMGAEPLDINPLTLEHVMPVTLTDDWRNELWDQAETIHTKNVNLLGNLTLCGREINSALSNSSFQIKKGIYANSPIKFTRRISKFDEWNENAISQRTEEISEKVLQLWPWQNDNQGSGDVDVIVNKTSIVGEYWLALKAKTDGVKGQKSNWQGRTQYSTSEFEDSVGIGVSVGADRIYIYVKSGEDKSSVNSFNRMKRYSDVITNNLTDQRIEGNVDSEAREGRSLTLVREFDIDELEDWDDSLNWVHAQCERMHEIIRLEFQ